MADPVLRLTPLTDREVAIVDSFDHHVPSPDQAARIGNLRAAFKSLAVTVLRHTFSGPDQTAALRQLHESMMTANKSIVCEPGTPAQATPAPVEALRGG